jgi:hypothetical protein
MNHLISKDAYNQIESMLIVRRNQIVQATSWMFNMVLLGLVLVTFGYFLYVQYNSQQEHQEEEKRIPFEPQVWYSATRNVRSEEYGRQLQPFEIETGYGLS